MTPKERFAKNLKYLRVTNFMSQASLAELLGLERSTVAYWELGKTEPSLATIEKICKIFDVDYNTLLGKRKNR